MEHGYRGDRNVADKRNRQLALSSGLASVSAATIAKLTGRFPSSVTLLTLNIKGAVYVSSASQFAEGSMLTPASRCRDCSLANVWNNARLTSLRRDPPSIAAGSFPGSRRFFEEFWSRRSDLNR